MTDEPARVSGILRRPDTAREVTMKDIARVAGVSPSTVSRVLSGAPPAVRIGAETRDRVVEVARSLGFEPNPVARALRGARTMLLGVIVGDITDPFFPGLVEAVGAAARDRGYNVVLGHARGRAREAVALKAVLETRHCDAIILLGDMPTSRGCSARLRRVPSRDGQPLAGDRGAMWASPRSMSMIATALRQSWNTWSGSVTRGSPPSDHDCTATFRPATPRSSS